MSATDATKAALAVICKSGPGGMQESEISAAIESGGVNTVDIACDGELWTPLMIASFNGQSVVAAQLLAKGAEVNLQDKYAFSALHLAASNGHLISVEVLVRAGADDSLKNRWGQTALEVAQEQGSKAVIDYLSPGGGAEEHRAAGRLSESDIREKRYQRSRSTRKSQIAKANGGLSLNNGSSKVDSPGDKNGSKEVDSSGEKRRRSTGKRRNSSSANNKEERLSLTENADAANSDSCAAAIVSMSNTEEVEITLDGDEGDQAVKMLPPRGCCILM